MKDETKFRQKADRDLDTLTEVFNESIQQKAIRGTPDKLLCVKTACPCGRTYGQFVAIEFKSDTKVKSKSEALQDYKLAKIRGAGGITFKVKPHEWDAAFNQLKKLKEKVS